MSERAFLHLMVYYLIVGSRPLLLHIGRVCAIFGRVCRTSQIQARQFQCWMATTTHDSKWPVHQAVQYHWILDVLPYRNDYIVVLCVYNKDLNYVWTIFISMFFFVNRPGFTVLEIPNVPKGTLAVTAITFSTLPAKPVSFFVTLSCNNVFNFDYSH